MRDTLDFYLHDWLAVGPLLQRPHFADHSAETFAGVLDTCERIAADKFAPFNRLVDTQEPHFDGQQVHLPQATHDAVAAYVASGMLAAAQDFDAGGMQLPCVVEMAANAFFSKASVSMAGYAMLTSGNANLLMAHGTPTQREVFAKNLFAGHWLGTMCLSEPQAGSSLSDVTTRAVPDVESSGVAFDADPLGPRYRLRGNKMWISGGEHEITPNIVHVALAGLNHKLGYRGTTNTLLNFGEGKFPVAGAAGAVGYLVGKPGEGLRCMFHMMNEARIGVGLGAVMLGYAGYEASLLYARQRTQGRPNTGQGKDAQAPQVPLVQHADVKRMLLAQKAYVEGGLALALYCARLVDELHTGDGAAAAEAGTLLDVLTPIAKSWPSEWCLEANSLAIQVHGGYGYTRDFAVEQHWRDNRLNMIHEGTHGIQALDLLGRKVVMNGGAGLQLLARRMGATVAAAQQADGLAPQAAQLAGALQQLLAATQAAWATGQPEEALANATPYLQAFGHVVLAWLWLDVAVASQRSTTPQAQALRPGKLAALRYFYAFELPKTGAWLQAVAAREPLLRHMQDAWF
jgi:alkylation response protein AidB-like acyl-CoA dehydrogenase